MTIKTWEVKVSKVLEDSRRLKLPADVAEALVDELDEKFESEKPFKVMGHNLFPVKL